MTQKFFLPRINESLTSLILVALALSAVFFVSSAKASESSCIILLNGEKSLVRDTAKLNSFVLYESEAISVLDKSFGSISAVLAPKSQQDVSHNAKLMFGTTTGYVVRVTPIESLSVREKMRASSADSLKNQELPRYSKLFGDPRAVISNISSYYDGKNRRSTFVVTSQKGVRVVKNNLPIELGYSHGALTAVATDKGVVVAFQERVRLYSESAAFEYKMTDIAQAEKKITLADTNAITGTTAVVDGQMIALITTEGQRLNVVPLPENESVESLLWNGQGTRLMVKTRNQMFVIAYENGQLRPYGAIPLSLPIYSASWEASGQYLAISTLTNTLVYDVEKREAQEINSRTSASGARVQWLDQDGLVVTISKAIGAPSELSADENGDVNQPYYWLVEFWDPATKRPVSAMRATLNMKDEHEVPPHVVSVHGRAFDGTLKFAILSEDGRLREVQQVLKSTFMKPSIIVPAEAPKKVSADKLDKSTKAAKNTVLPKNKLN